MSLKIQFGCGENRLDGWVNHDIDLDVTKPPYPFPYLSADRIHAEHLGEHLTGPELLNFLTECYKILKPGGVMRLCCPVIKEMMGRGWARDLTLGHGHKLVLNRDVMTMFLWMAGFEMAEIRQRPRISDDGHWKIIGEVKDDHETCRMEATK
jgi:predicted SAM-dependent methyltransferase